MILTQNFGNRYSKWFIFYFSDLSNSWECAKCMNSGYSSVPSRQRQRQHSGENDEHEQPDPKRSKSEMHQDTAQFSHSNFP